MNRRSVLKLLGLAPVAAPAVAAVAQPAPEVARIAPDGVHIHGRIMSVPSLSRVPAPTDAASWIDARRAVAPDGSEWMIAPDGRAWEARRPV